MTNVQTNSAPKRIRGAKRGAVAVAAVVCETATAAAEPATPDTAAAVAAAKMAADADTLAAMMANPGIDNARIAAFQQMLWAKAFNAAAAKIAPIAREATNEDTASKYASFHQLDEALRPIFSAAGLSYTFDTEPSPRVHYLRVIGYLIHTLGHERKYAFEVPASALRQEQTATHAAQSAYTIGKRYVLGAMSGIATKDDDGNAAGKKPAAAGAVNGSGDTLDKAEQAALALKIAESGMTLDEFLSVQKLQSLSDVLKSKLKPAEIWLGNAKASRAKGKEATTP